MKEKRAEARSASKKSRQEKMEREYEEYRAQQLKAMLCRVRDNLLTDLEQNGLLRSTTDDSCTQEDS